MKKLSLLIILFSTLGIAQVSIGKEDIANSSVILEFGNDNNKGIILPWVTSTTNVDAASNEFTGNTTGAEPGTFVFDTSDNRVKVKTQNGWLDLSDEDGTSDTSLQSTLNEHASAQIIIGAEESSADGILVLESNSQAMVLPIVNTYTDITNPTAGMMVYIKDSQKIAFFNGRTWSFWGS